MIKNILVALFLLVGSSAVYAAGDVRVINAVKISTHSIAALSAGVPSSPWSYHENSSNALTDTTVHASCGTGLYNYITSLTASSNAATAFSIMIEDSTNSTILGPYYLEAVAGRGLSVVFPGGKKQTNSATLISVTTTGAIAHGIDITGFCAP